MTQTEDSVVQAIKRYLKTLPQCKFKKRRGGITNAGLADLYGSVFGLHFEIEVKAPGGRPTKRQKAQLEDWEDAGCMIYGVAWSKEDARKIILDGLKRYIEKSDEIFAGVIDLIEGGSK